VALDLLIRKYFAVVVLAFLALAAYFQASGVTELVGAGLLTPAASGSLAMQRSSPPLPIPHSDPRTAQPIIERNPFDSVTGNLIPKEPEGETPPPGPDLSDPLSAPACDNVSALIVTESTDPEWSVAALMGSGEPHPRLRRTGDEVAGKKVVFIGYNPRDSTPSVWLTGGGQLCQAQLFRVAAAPVAAAEPAPAPAPAASEAPPPPTPGRGPTPLPPEIAAKIQKVSDTEFHVDRSVVDKILEDQAELMRSARIVPEQKDGKMVGVRLFGIRPDTLLGKLGLQNGDRLETINGYNMASPEKALEAYARLRTANGLSVKVNRRGSPVGIQYNIK
jgi:general secretion pathway protein C